MKTIGLIGGISWQSTLEYYRIINEEVNRRLGGLHSAQILLYSLNLHDIEELIQKDNWPGVGTRMVVSAKVLDKGGVDMILLCSNTLHKVAEDIETAGTVPMLHICDAVGEAIQEKGMKTVGLLGTQYTMEGGFHARRLMDRWGIEVLVPEREDRETLNEIITRELCRNMIHEASLKKINGMVEGLAARGVQAVILGCAGLSPVIDPAQSNVPLMDSTALHATKAVSLALNE